MVGKIKRIRHKLHQDAVKVDHSQSGLEKPPLTLPAEVKGLAFPGIIKTFDINQRTNKSDTTKETSKVTLMTPRESSDEQHFLQNPKMNV